MSVLVERAGFLTTVQDLGRMNHRTSGVSLGGALDTHALRVANLLVGNDDHCAGLEFTLGNARLRFSDTRLIAWCGGPFGVVVAGKQIPSGHAAILQSGDALQFVSPANGGRAWLAISGGIDVPLILGSRATDLRSKFGGFKGRALRDGDELSLGEASVDMRNLKRTVANWSAPNEWSNTRPSYDFLRIVRGAECDQFSDRALLEDTFTVTPDSGRMGVRLHGHELARTTKRDLISEPVAPGTIQVPPNGQPILLLGDCQTIGGYPKIAHVITVDLPAAAQLRPDDTVRFVEVSLGEAQQLRLQREWDLETFRIGVSLRTKWN